MLLILSDELFATPDNHAELMALFYLCSLQHDPMRAELRHLLTIDPPAEITSQPLLSKGVVVQGQCVNLIAWLGGFDEATRDELTQTLMAGQRRANLTPSAAPMLWIDAQASTLCAAAIARPYDLHAPLSEALRLLMQPLRVLVENSLNDRCFIENVSEPARGRLQQAITRGWLRFEHAGGVDSMPQLIDSYPAYELARMFVIADRDNDTAELSADAERVQCVCNKELVTAHIWTRRAIENYIPLEALEQYPALCGETGQNAAAFLANLKSWWTAHNAVEANGWRSRYGRQFKKVYPDGLGGVQGISTKRGLDRLFQPELRRRHITDSDWQQWMTDEGTADELSAVVQEILRRL
jgi:hypothetical protein